MELEDAILSTLKEIEDKGKSKLLQSSSTFKEKIEPSFEVKEKKVIEIEEETLISTNEEEQFLSSTRERLLVLFEGFQAPNNTNIEAKIDLTLNYLEYMLASIDSRLEKIKEHK